MAVMGYRCTARWVSCLKTLMHCSRGGTQVSRILTAHYDAWVPGTGKNRRVARSIGLFTPDVTVRSNIFSGADFFGGSYSYFPKPTYIFFRQPPRGRGTRSPSLPFAGRTKLDAVLKNIWRGGVRGGCRCLPSSVISLS
jgi:hypothetical protein